MFKNIIDIHHENRFLAIEDGFLMVYQTHKTQQNSLLQRIYLEDIGALIISNYGLTLTSWVCSIFAEKGIPTVFSGRNFMPIGMLLGLDGNFEQGRRFDAQMNLTEPQKKRLWQQIIKAKLLMQSRILQGLDLLEQQQHRQEIHIALTSLAKNTRSGDPDNHEGQGAKLYWRSLFGAEFRRDRELADANSFLNMVTQFYEHQWQEQLWRQVCTPRLVCIIIIFIMLIVWLMI